MIEYGSDCRHGRGKQTHAPNLAYELQGIDPKEFAKLMLEEIRKEMNDKEIPPPPPVNPAVYEQVYDWLPPQGFRPTKKRFESLTDEQRLLCGLTALKIVGPEIQRLLTLHNPWPESYAQFCEEIEGWLATRDAGTSDRVLQLYREKIYRTGFGQDEFDVWAMDKIFEKVMGLLFAMAPTTKHKDDPKPDRSGYLDSIQYNAERLHKLMKPESNFLSEWRQQCKEVHGIKLS